MQELQQHLEATEQRLDAFLVKLAQRAQELLNGFEQEAVNIRRNDTIYGQAYSRFLAATRGQVQKLREKVKEVEETQIMPVFYRNCTQSSLAGFSSMVYEWRNRCQAKILQWEEQLYARESAAIERAEWQDYETVFQSHLQQYHAEKEKVYCKQCGAKLAINQVYYYTVYITCTFCQTQNIFNPGTSARQLEDTARKLAEQRSRPVLEQQQFYQQRERDLYMQAHELQLSLIHEKNNQIIKEKQQAIARLEEQRQEAVVKAPQLMEEYHRSVFDELNNLLPDLREHHEKFYRAITTHYQ